MTAATGSAVRSLGERLAGRAGWAAAAASLIRPADTGLIVLGSLVGARVAHPELLAPAGILVLALANGLLGAGSMAFNDWHDVREDAINKPRRAVVAGRISRAAALRLAGLLFALAVVAAAAVGPRFGLAALSLAGLSVAYTTRLKGMPGIGNGTVAAVTAYPVWCWLLAGAKPTSTYLAVCVTLVAYRMGAEMVKTAEDWRGDEASRLATVATRWGPWRALRAGCGWMALANLLASWPLVAGTATPLYTAGIGLAAVLTGWACVHAGRVAERPEVVAGRLVRLERVTMVVGALVYTFGLT